MNDYLKSLQEIKVEEQPALTQSEIEDIKKEWEEESENLSNQENSLNKAEEGVTTQEVTNKDKNDLFAKKQCKSFEESVDQCMEALIVQVKKHKAKLVK